MKDLRTRLSFFCLTGFFALGAAEPASAASAWLECSGTEVTTGTVDGKPENKTEPSHEVFSLDDGVGRLYKYSESRKATDPEPIEAYGAQEVVWGEKARFGTEDPDWEARLDRKTLVLKKSFRVHGETTTWDEQCKPTDPR